MVVNVELGTFLAFLAVPTLTLIFMTKIRGWGLTGYVLFLGTGALSFVMLGGLTLMMMFGYNVVMSEHVALADSNGTATGTEDHTTPIITSFQDLWSYIFGAYAIVFGLIYFVVMVTGGGR